MEAKAKKAAPLCGCGKQSRLIAYSTFDYFYCDACKAEPKDKEKPRAVTATGARNESHSRWSQPINLASLGKISPPGGAPPPQKRYQPATRPTPAPYGFEAIKGEFLNCAVCNDVCSSLKADLPVKMLRRLHVAYANSMFSCACGQADCTRYDSALHVQEYFVEGRGWV